MFYSLPVVDAWSVFFAPDLRCGAASGRITFYLKWFLHLRLLVWELGITPDWNDWGKLILVLTMYAGRIGVLTFVLSFLHSKDDKIRYLRKILMIG